MTVAVVEKQYQIIKPKHGYYKGECLDADVAPTIDTGVGCWHTLIGESYGTENQMRIDRLTQRGGYERMHDIARRVYRTDGLAPTMHTCGGGNLEPKILEPLALDEQNGYIRQDGCVGTLTTDGNSPKHNNRVVEPNYRIRKLTPHECFKLMGVRTEDYEKIAKNQSDSSQYHLAGDSICCTCLMAIFGELFGIDYETKINSLTEELRK